MAISFPPIYLLSAHFENKARLDLEKEIGKSLVYDIREAHVVVGKVANKKRARLELAKQGLNTEDATAHENGREYVESPRRKRRSAGKVDGKEVIALDSSTESESEEVGGHGLRKRKSPGKPVRNRVQTPTEGDKMQVVKLEWYTDSIKAGKVLPTTGYVVYEGRLLPPGAEAKPPKRTALPTKDIVTRAKADTPPPASQRPFHKTSGWGSQRRKADSPNSPRPHLLHETTSDHDVNVPPVPEFLKTQWSCQRPSFAHGPNEDFTAQLRIILKARKMKGDDVGELSYNKAIATLNAYPHTITSTRELAGLPGLGEKMQTVWKQWKDTGRIDEVDEIENDEDLKIIGVFWDIHDVGEKTAVKFWEKGWKDLDDLVTYGWDKLTRNQQIGVKYYDDFKLRIPRYEVEHIAQVILDHANELRPGFQMVICGGYRRGKSDSGDVDVVLSHPDEEATSHFLKKLLEILEKDGYITHQLTTSISNSERDQKTLKWKGLDKHKGSGFDTLDHCFCVWREPTVGKNMNPHRRVDIIISPWKTAGCAVVGWSGATLFERHIRGYCNKELGYKFDSSGVRRRDDGNWVDLEGWGEGEKGDLLVKEKRVFKGLGLEWREPSERCTD